MARPSKVEAVAEQSAKQPELSVSEHLEHALSESPSGSALLAIQSALADLKARAHMADGVVPDSLVRAIRAI